VSAERLAELKARWLPVYLVLLVAVALLVIHLALMYLLTGNSAYVNLALLSALALYFLYANFDRLRKLRVERRRLVEVLACGACGYREERDHESGDYVLKEKGACPRCGGTLIVAAIFSLREQQ